MAEEFRSRIRAWVENTLILFKSIFSSLLKYHRQIGPTEEEEEVRDGGLFSRYCTKESIANWIFPSRSPLRLAFAFWGQVKIGNKNQLYHIFIFPFLSCAAAFAWHLPRKQQSERSFNLITSLQVLVCVFRFWRDKKWFRSQTGWKTQQTQKAIAQRTCIERATQKGAVINED